MSDHHGRDHDGHDDNEGHDADDQLMAEVRAAVDSADPLPPRLLDAAKAAFVWRTIDEELAHLQFDSLAGSEIAVRSGAADSVVHLSFASSEASIEVDLSGRAIDGQVVPPAAEVFLLLASGERIPITCDDLGQFGLERSVSGPVRLVARLPAGDVVTEWFTV
jgi:hypothetical protein